MFVTGGEFWWLADANQAHSLGARQYALANVELEGRRNHHLQLNGQIVLERRPPHQERASLVVGSEVAGRIVDRNRGA